eukprot:scaffold111_cov142-Skeletonema_menzelii.AAC.15
MSYVEEECLNYAKDKCGLLQGVNVPTEPSQDDFDMNLFFRWQLKFLPLMIAWFEIASIREFSWRDRVGSPHSQFREFWLENFQRREFSSIYQFVRGLPLLTVAVWNNQKTTDTESKKRKFDRH